MTIDKKNLDKRISSDWKQVRSIPVPSTQLKDKEVLEIQAPTKSALATPKEGDYKPATLKTNFTKELCVPEQTDLRPHVSDPRINFKTSIKEIPTSTPISQPIKLNSEKTEEPITKDTEKKYKKLLAGLKKKYQDKIIAIQDYNIKNISSLEKQIQALEKKKTISSQFIHKDAILTIIKEKEELQQQLKSYTQNQQTQVPVPRSHPLKIHHVQSSHLEEKIIIRSHNEDQLHKLRLQSESEKQELIHKLNEKEKQLIELHEQQLGGIKEKQKSSIQSLIDTQGESISKLKSSHKKDIDELRYENQSVLEEIHKKYKDTISSLENSISTRITELKTEHENQIEYMIKETEGSLVSGKVRNKELIELYDKDTVAMKRDLIALQSLTRVQKKDLDRVLQENQAFISRIETLLSENTKLKEQNQLSQDAWMRIDMDLEQKTKQISSLQKLNQHISQSLFQSKRNIEFKEQEGLSDKEPKKRLLSDLHLY